MRSCRLAWLFGLLWLCGCESNHYQITLTPEKEAIKRQLVCWRQSGDSKQATKGFSPQELRLLADAYQMPEAIAVQPNRFSFAGDFSTTLPDDVGGAGRYLRWNSRLGSAAIYLERFRGNDDLAGLIDQRRQAADLLADLLLEWFSAELHDQPKFAQLRAFLDEDLRRDLRNLVVYGVMAESLSQTQADPQAQFRDFAARYGLYLVERGYVSEENLPVLFNAMQAGDDARLRSFLREFLGRKMELPPAEADGLLKFLASEEAIKSSFERFVKDSRTYRMLVEQMHAKYEQSKQEPAKIDEVLYYLTTEAGFALLRADDHLDVTLKCAVPPVATNGQWDPKLGAIKWTNRLAPRAAQPAGCVPLVHYAVWTTPDVAVQRKLLGRVALDGELLAQYALWHQQLTEVDAHAWDDFLSSLSTSTNALEAIAKFRFGAEPVEPSGKKPGLSETPRRLLAEALSKKVTE